MTKSALNPSELQFLLPESKANTGALFGGASLSWVVIALAAAFLVWLRPDGPISRALPTPHSFDLVYVQELGLGSNGGGGGNRMPDPPRTAPVPKVTAIEPDPLPVATADPIPEPEPILAAQSNAITDSNAFAVLGPTSNTSSLSRGPGIDDGAGGKKGTGNGPENGPGLGPKQGGNDLPLRPGPGLTNPTLISSAKPSYTAEAMLRRIRGVVALECVIARNGSVDSCTVIESLDRVFGLDEEAIKAARQFRFTPGRKDGQPVPVFVRIEIRFNMQ